MHLGPITPILRIFDEQKAREFYDNFLGFTVDFEHRFDDNAPLYMGISRDGCVIHLSEHHGDCCPGSSVRIETKDLDRLHRELTDKNYKYYRPSIQDTSWGTRDMAVVDPFGNRLTFTATMNVQRDEQTG
ncbi:MAG: VOC family protein [Cyanothece sp. SIO2G6]|nr:VOC family protein [Cyanothece sp. SIO2G6]